MRRRDQGEKEKSQTFDEHSSFFSDVFPFRKSCYTYIINMVSQYDGNIANQRLHLPSSFSEVNMYVQEWV